jgi:hypothetical protein
MHTKKTEILHYDDLQTVTGIAQRRAKAAAENFIVMLLDITVLFLLECFDCLLFG